MLRLGEALGALTMGHVVFAGAGIINAAATPPRSPPPLASAPLASTAVAKVVTAMYSGAGIDGAALSDDAIFTDPAASCVGRAEVVEAFRALGASCSPEHVAPPLAVSQRTVSTASGPGGGRGTTRERVLSPPALLQGRVLFGPRCPFDSRRTHRQRRPHLRGRGAVERRASAAVLRLPLRAARERHAERNADPVRFANELSGGWRLLPPSG